MTDTRDTVSATSYRELLIIEPRSRYDALIEGLTAAKESIDISVFRCDHPAVVQTLVAAHRRGVEVRVLLTNRARGSKKQLADLHRALQREAIQAVRYSGPHEKYHPKYAVIDGTLAVLGSMNFTRENFSETDDFMIMALDRDLISTLAPLFEMDWRGVVDRLADCSPRLIVSPDNARHRLYALIEEAERSIVIVDHKLEDPGVLWLVTDARRRGVEVELFTERRRIGRRAHGKAMVIDDEVAIVGSLALSKDTLDWRRDMALVVRTPCLVNQLLEHIQAIRLSAGRAETAVA